MVPLGGCAHGSCCGWHVAVDSTDFDEPCAGMDGCDAVSLRNRLRSLRDFLCRLVRVVVAIRNFAVAQGVAPAGANTLVYVVPDSHAFIFKSLKIAATAPTPTAVVSLYLGSGSAGANDFFDHFDISSGNPVDFGTWFVMNAGNAVYLYVLEVDITYWISGAVLPYASPPVAHLLPAQEWPINGPLP